MEKGISTKDLKLFFKGNVKLISLITLFFVIIGTGFVGYKEITNYLSTTENGTEQERQDTETEIQGLLNTDPDELTTEEERAVNKYLSEGAYYFKVFIENPDYTSFGRTNLLTEALLNDEVLQLVNNEMENELSINPEYTVHVTQNTDTMLQSFIFTTGNQFDSKVLADAYFSLLTNNQLDILEDRSIYIFEEPTLLEFEDPKNDELNLASAESSKVDVISSVLFAVIVSAVFGVLFGGIVSVIKDKMKGSIGYLFNYELDFNDTIVDVESDNESIDQQLIHLLTPPSNSENIILYEQTTIFKKTAKSIQKNKEKEFNTISFVSDVLDTDPKIDIDEIVLIIEINETSKEWFEEQMNYLSGYRVPKKIIRIY